MSLFNPETVFRTLFSMLGISGQEAAQIAALLQRAPQFVAQMEAEMTAFKRGTAGMVADFQARLDALDARLARIETLLTATREPSAMIAYRANGTDHE